MDWKLCLICQNQTKEVLKCPLNALGSVRNITPYETFLERSAMFRELDSLPVPLGHLEESITAMDLVENKASWHKSCHKKFDQDKLDRAKRKWVGSEIQDVNVKRACRKRQLPEKSGCILCGEKTGAVHEFRTLDADANIRKMAGDLEDTALLAKLEGGDLIALEAKYHLECLTKLRNKHRSLLRANQDSPECQIENQKKARAFTELVTYIESAVNTGTFCFKFVDLRHLFENRLKEFGIHTEVNKVRFKEKILSHFNEAQAENDEKNTILIFQQGMQQILKNALSADCESDAIILAKAAATIRRDIFNNGFRFSGSFPPGCQETSVPFNLKYLLSMLLNGPNLKDQDSADSQACLTLSRMILFNSKKGKSTQNKSRHSQVLEPPLPLYIGMNVHTQTRSKKLVTQLCQFGLSVSYDRVLQVENQLATGVCQHIAEIGLVCPRQFHHGHFTIGALDNLDHNPSSTTATDSFHGTGISTCMFQFLSSHHQNQGIVELPVSSTQKRHQLPDDYTVVPAVVLAKGSVTIPKPSKNKTVEFSGHLVKAKSQENSWLEHAAELLKKETLEKGDTVTWASYHASSNQDVNDDPHLAVTQLMPLFYEKAATAAMVKHGMVVQHKATEFLNPGQIPVTAFDAPLYALAKQVQWKWPETHGEDKYVVMLGGLHIEMAVWSTLGDFLEDSGWTAALIQAGIASSSTADSFLKAAHLTRTRHGHQVCAVALSMLQHDAFLYSNEENMEAWKEKMVESSPTFQFWDIVLRLEIMGLIFVRAHRTANFSLYIESLRCIVPWFFALDHHHYARWLPVHIRDMKSLPPAISFKQMDIGWSGKP